MNDYENAIKSLASAQAQVGRVATLRERTQYELEAAELNVARLKELNKLLDANPATQRILELLGRG